MSITWEDPMGENCGGIIRRSPVADRSGLLGRGGAVNNLEGVLMALLRRASLSCPTKVGAVMSLGSSCSIGSEHAVGRGFNDTGVLSPFASLKVSSSMVNSDTCSNTPTKSELLVCWACVLDSAIPE